MTISKNRKERIFVLHFLCAVFSLHWFKHFENWKHFAHSLRFTFLFVNWASKCVTRLWAIFFSSIYCEWANFSFFAFLFSVLITTIFDVMVILNNFNGIHNNLKCFCPFTKHFFFSRRFCEMLKQGNETFYLRMCTMYISYGLFCAYNIFFMFISCRTYILYIYSMFRLMDKRWNEHDRFVEKSCHSTLKSDRKAKNTNFSKSTFMATFRFLFNFLVYLLRLNYSNVFFGFSFLIFFLHLFFGFLKFSIVVIHRKREAKKLKLKTVSKFKFLSLLFYFNCQLLREQVLTLWITIKMQTFS